MALHKDLQHCEHITEVAYSTASHAAILAHGNKSTLAISRPRKPPIKHQEIQAYIQHLQNWEIEVKATIGSLHVKSEALEDSVDAVEELVMHLSSLYTSLSNS